LHITLSPSFLPADADAGLRQLPQADRRATYGTGRQTARRPRDHGITIGFHTDEVTVHLLSGWSYAATRLHSRPSGSGG